MARPTMRENLRVHADAVIQHTNEQIPFAKFGRDLNARGLRMPIGVAHRLTHDAKDVLTALRNYFARATLDHNPIGRHHPGFSTAAALCGDFRLERYQGALEI